MWFNTAPAGLFDLAREGESHYSSMYFPRSHTHTINLGPFDGSAYPVGWGVEHTEDGSLICYLPPDDASFHTDDQLIASKDYEYLRLVIAKQYGLTLAQTDGMTTREMLARIELAGGAQTIKIE